MIKGAFTVRSLLTLSGTEIILSENVVDISKALDVSLFQHMTIRCNRPASNSSIPNDVSCENPVKLEPPDKTLAATVLSTVVGYGHFWLPLVILLVLIVGISCCCYKRRRAANRGGKMKGLKDEDEVEKQKALATQKPPQIVVRKKNKTE